MMLQVHIGNEEFEASLQIRYHTDVSLKQMKSRL